MRFEAAINNASTLFLFDRRSQQQLQEMVEATQPRSRDRYLIRLTQAAFAYYNAGEVSPDEMRAIIRHASGILREVKRFREDRVYFTMALRLEVDLLLQLSALAFQEAVGSQRERAIYNEEDGRALSIAETLLKNLPASLDPLPSTWYSGVVPLFPPFRDETLRFYKDRLQENRIEQLQLILKRIKEELIVAAGMVKAKQFLAENRVVVGERYLTDRYLATTPPNVLPLVQRDIPELLQLASDITMPRGVSAGHLETAVTNVRGQIDEARRQKDLRKYTGHLLQLGILHFLQERSEDAVSALVRTLQASSRINPEDKKIRQYRHEEFPDIPFMVGTSCLRLLPLAERLTPERRPALENAVAGLMQALTLQPRYHQAYVNLVAALYRLHGPAQGAPKQEATPPPVEAVLRLYAQRFERKAAELSEQAPRNLAFLMLQDNAERVTPDIVKWLLLARFFTGGEQTPAKKMLQELKTLYVLNAHEFSVQYLESYRRGFRMKDQAFIADLENNELHSALLFYIAHGFTSLSLQQGRDNGELVIDHDNLDQGIELNAESLYFHPGNSSALRLLDTQLQVLQFAVQRTQKRWENINNTMGQRFQFYEEWLRQEKSYRLLSERMENLRLGDRVPPLRLSPTAENRMRETITEPQRDRLRGRVERA